MFSSCPTLEECQDCVTEDGKCLALGGSCSGPVQSHLTDNVIDIVSDVHEEFACKEACIADTRCNFYTYHTENNSILRETCFLLTGLRDPMKPCQNCLSGPADCFNKDGCLFLLDGGNTTNKLLLSDTSTKHTFIALTLGLCNTTGILTVGGGGTGSDSASGGGGSGYTNFIRPALSVMDQFEVNVGPHGHSSTVWLNNKIVIEAESGEDYSGHNGGDGYSGGGGYGSSSGGDGGSDGGDGEDGGTGAGGKGSNVDVSSIVLNGFVLT